LGASISRIPIACAAGFLGGDDQAHWGRAIFGKARSVSEGGADVP